MLKVTVIVSYLCRVVALLPRQAIEIWFVSRTRGNPLQERGMPSYHSLHRPQQRCDRVREMRPSCRGVIIEQGSSRGLGILKL